VRQPRQGATHLLAAQTGRDDPGEACPVNTRSAFPIGAADAGTMAAGEFTGSAGAPGEGEESGMDTLESGAAIRGVRRGPNLGAGART